MKRIAYEAMMREIESYNRARSESNHELSLYHLGRAHIISQKSTRYHLYVHFLMLLYALERTDLKEIIGQILRLTVTVPGHILGKVPKGNIGWATIGLTQELPIPDDLKDLN